jgi:hypothetical protein
MDKTTPLKSAAHEFAVWFNVATEALYIAGHQDMVSRLAEKHSELQRQIKEVANVHD